MRTDLYLRTKTSTTHLFQQGVANDVFHRTYVPGELRFVPNPKTFVITACGQILSTGVTIKTIVTGREIKCGDCRSLFEVVSKGVDISDDIVRGVA